MTAAQSAPAVGFAGLGTMGAGVVRRLLHAGHAVFGLEPHAGEGRAALSEGMALGRHAA